MALLRFSVRSSALIVLSAFVLTAANLVAQSVNPIPLVNQPLLPDAAAPGSPGLTLTVNGTGFVPTSVVNWNGTPLSTAFVNVHQLVADVPASALASASTASVTVSSPAPGGGTSNAVPFTVTSPTTSLAFATSTVSVGVDPTAIVVADFNNDGKADLAVLNLSQPDASCYPVYGYGTISILLGNGDGTFSNKSTLCFPGGPGTVTGPQLVAGDFNGDGKTDLVASFTLYGNTSPIIFLGNGDGTFASGQSVGFGGFSTGTFVTGDFNRDGKLDLALSADALGFDGIFVFFGEGDGTLGQGFVFGPMDVYSWSPLATGDFNNDGILDLAVMTSQSVAILLGNGDGWFSLAPSQPDVNPGGMIVGDFNGDGILDLIVGNVILFGNGDGTFTQGPAQPCSPIATADFNGDGKLDLVCSTAENTISILLGNGGGTFQPGWIEATDYAQVAVGDFNGDGRLDLAVTNSSDNTVSILLQRPARPGVTITLASGQNPVYVNQSVTYTVVAWASPTMPTGSVAFKQGATILGTVPLADGQATFTTTFTKAGTFPIVASYSGDQNYPAKNSKAVKQVVSKYATYADLYSDFNPSVYGQAVSLRCYVGSYAPNQPTGTVTFRNGPSLLGTVPLVNGFAILAKKNLPAGTILITATYNGDAVNSESTSDTLSQVVSQATTTTTVTSSPNPSVVGQNVKFKAMVNSPTVVPIGTVTFTSGTTTLGTVGLAGGKDSLITSALPAGTTTVTATYNGTPNITGSSGAVVQTVK
jgi:hypothetical protein